MTVTFALPAAWCLAGSAQGLGPAESEVKYADLGDGLCALAAEGGWTTGEVVLAAHVKVLGMLTEDRGLRTDAIVAGPDGRAGSVRVCSVTVQAHPTWRLLTRHVAEDVRSAIGHAALPGWSSPRPVHVIFRAARDDCAPADGCAPGDRYGLEVIAYDGRLLLRTRCDAVRPGRLTALAGMYRLVLEAMAADPDGDALASYLPSQERHAVLSQWSAGACARRDQRSVDALIGAQAARTPDALAVRTAQGELTYRELDERANRVARYLSALGARPDVIVGVCLRRCIELLPALLGLWKAGAAYLPLDPDQPAERLALMVEAARCDLVVTMTELQTALGPASGVRQVPLDAVCETIDMQPPCAPGISADPGRLAYVIYTSGSTGTPKGVMVEHRGLVNYLMWTVEAYAGRGSGGSAAFSSIGFDLGIPSLFTPLLTGQPVHLLPEPLRLADLGDQLAAGGPYSFLKMTPAQLDLLSLDFSADQARNLAGIVIAAGDSFASELARRWIELAGPDGTAVATEYGPTEITVGNSGQPVTEPPPSLLVPLGVPIPNTSMYVLTDLLQPVPVGVPGEVYVGGAGVARGYLHRPALTAERFVADPYGPPGSRLYKTGDRARWLHDGSLEFLGRVDHQIKIRGYRVEPGEVEEYLRRHPGVAEAIVVGTGESARSQSLAAFVVSVAGADAADPAELAGYLADHLPEYMIPARFVAIDHVPLTGNGKVDVRTLRGRLSP